MFYKLTDFTGIAYNTTASASELASVAYSHNPYVSTVINRIASVASYLKLENDVPILDLNTKYKAYVSLLLFGETFILGIKPVGMSEVRQLEVLANTDVVVEYDETSVFKPIKLYRYRTVEYQPSQILHIKYANAVSIYPRGRSPLESAQAVYKASNSIGQFEQYLYDNRGVVGLLSGVGDTPLTSTEQIKLQGQFDSDTTGVKSAGKIKLVQNEVRYTPISFKPSEMLSAESQLEKLRTICSLYNVDSSLFNDKASSTYNNISEANKAFYNNAVLPVCDFVLSELSLFLDLPEPVTVDYNDIDALKKDAVLNANAKATMAAARKTFIDTIAIEMSLGLLTVEEAKAKIIDYDM
jgi:HK97 family phage portal protein